MRRPAFWLAFAALSLAAAVVAVRYFPRAFSIVALDITMDREQALARARELMARDSLGPAGYRQAASFALDSEAQTFIELEGGGKDAFTAMLRNGLYSAYTWRVRQFKEGETHETTIRFTPEGRPYGFVEKLTEDAPGAALDAGRRAGDRRTRRRRAGTSTCRSSRSPSRARSAASAGGSTTPSPTSAPAPPPAKAAIGCGWSCPATG